MNLKSTFSLLAAFLFAGTQAISAQFFGLDDISNWVGTGSQTSALVVDWNDGQGSVAWGFRYDGTATAFDMVAAVAAADSRFSVIESTDYDDTVVGMGYDRDGDGFSVTPSVTFTDGMGLAGSADADGLVSNDLDDSFAAGWFTNGFFAFFTSMAEPYLNDNWEEAMIGAGTFELTDGSWSGFTWAAAPGWSADAPVAPVPEPSTYAALLGLAACGFVFWRRRRA
ncbi:MAG: PEP-CTERM sorting domain-containing protein [Verrucomicrobiota bacterium JB022]|nr:PEP-CTERM sorting domain-containing protein [Verrucomicrobiota bacterium JB022]